VAPTIFDGVKPDDRSGARRDLRPRPVGDHGGQSTDEAIEVANDTDYGLAASVFTANAKTAIRAARAIRAGTVTVNCYGEGDISTPFGGYKQSGFGGRDNGIHAHDQYTELKTIWIDLSDSAPGKRGVAAETATEPRASRRGGRNARRELRTDRTERSKMLPASDGAVCR
jgi:gamma-glutamyl-gamma-aminobutyraldehyde dehydrogenase